MEEFDEAYLDSLIKEALDDKGTSQMHPSSGMHLGFAESDLMSLVYDKLTNHFPESSLNSFFQEFRSDLVARKVSLSIKDLHTVTRNCRKCSLSSTAELPKWNVTDPDVLIILESPNIQSDAVDLLVSKVKSSGFTSSQLCLTYVNRCPKPGKYENNEIINCSPYLHTEIQILNPKVIVPMGSLVTSVLLNSDIKIKDYRGNLMWLGYWPIVPTYSPAYALRSGASALQNFENDLSYVYKFINT
jgi:uracil-DNA glycosylase family 4